MATENHVAQAMDLPARTEAETSIFKFRAPAAGEFVRIKIWSSITLSSGEAIFDVNLNGTTVFTDQGSRPKISQDNDNTQRVASDFDVLSVAKDDIITVDFDSFTSGQTTTGDLDIVIELSET